MSHVNGEFKNKSIIESFKNAINGICKAVKSERNLIIHIVATVIVVTAGIIFRIDLFRWICLTLVIGFVLVSELLNTAIEKLTDMVTTEYSEQARKVKDIGAAAVLISAVISVIVGILIFLQPVIDFFID
ncbi:MAG: diacylglycerol kinase family protein [Clostridiaceae bacterium]|nr:diacylglycerol kinase family protein [Clostridiaceae bacterium]